MFDAKHLDDVQTVNTILRGSYNSGTTFSNEKGWYKGLFHVWLVRNGIVNLLSLPPLESEGYRVTYDTVTDWVIHVPDGPLMTHGTKLVLKWGHGVCAGFPYLDMADPAHKNSVVMLKTVRANMKGLTIREVKKYVLARKAQARVGTPTEADFIEMVSKGTLTNCSVTLVDIANTRHVFGPDLPGIKSNTVWRKPARVEVEDYLVTRTILDDYHRFVSVTLTADVMFVNGLPFLVTMSRRIWLLTVEHTPSRTAKQLGSSITKVVNLYAWGGFVINTVLMDQEFDKIVDEVPKLEINTTVAREHVG